MDLKGSLRSSDATATRMSGNDRFHKQDNNFVRVSQFFLYISLPFFHNEDVKMPNFWRFMENVNKERRGFFFGGGGRTWIWSLGIHLQQFHLYLT